jgi:CubicO group peptidase (beta-lactamase class C family)
MAVEGQGPSPNEETVMRRICVVAVAVLVFAGRLTAAPLEAAVDAAVRAAGVTPETPGVAVLVIDHREVLLRKGYGLANLKDRTPIRPETTFELASLSKPFTATAVCILHDQGKLAFDDPVRKYVPELPDLGRKPPIRLHHLLHHTSGLPDYTGWPQPKGRDPNYVGNEDYARLIRDNPRLVEQHFAAGQKYEYSNTNFMLLALIVERVSKKSYGTFLQEEIFKPLGMVNSWVNERPDSTPKHPRLGYVNAVGYEKNDRGRWKETWGAAPFRSETLLTTGDGAIWTNLEDMARWDAGVRSGKLLEAQTWQQARTRSKTRDGQTNDYGYGWGLEGDGKVTGYGHNGGWGGFNTLYIRQTVKDRAVVVLSNRGGFDVEKIREAVDECLDHPENNKPGRRR